MGIRNIAALVLFGAALAPGQIRFETAETCAMCHTDISGPGGGLIGPAALWPSTMMAHSAVDPYWQAKVRYEAATTPAAASVIENKCLSCHAPMQRRPLREAGRKLALDDLAGPGLEGVSCTVCHQITPEGFGEKSSFTAGFTLNEQARIYGPHENPFPMPMRHHTGYTPTESQHILESELCATCHTVVTPTLDAQGKTIGEFVEQAPYLEWRASSYAGTETTCQSCHLPVLEDERGRPIPQFIAHTPMGGFFGPTRPRTPYGQHFLVGGNVQALGMLAELFPDRRDGLDQTAARTRANLTDALGLRVTANESDGFLDVEVRILNRTGHKLPTGYPSRRLWLQMTTQDAVGRTLFESGAPDPATGEIRGLEGVEPHRDLITAENQVAIWEAALADAAGRPTVTLMRAAGYAKDNRILPRGFDLARPQPDGIDPASIAPVGVAGDDDFRPGSDGVRYRIEASETGGPYRIDVRVWFQSVRPDHLGGMSAARSKEEARFLELYPRHNAPTLVAEKTLHLAR